MPNLDGTGPQEQGSLTGRRRGRCSDKEKTDTLSKTEENREVIYEHGRCGKPHGGAGYGKGQRKRNGFGRNQTFGK